MTYMLVIVFSLFYTACSQHPQGSSHRCSRPCDRIPLTCSYEFHVEWFQTLSRACFNCPQNVADCDRHDCIPGDGYSRTVQVVNRMMPGPKIEVCEGDIVEVNVHNGMHAESTSIHWHGMHQLETPYMDGVPFITQCPIHPETGFKYRFKAVQAGTHFWHSHSSVQRGNGVMGALVVREDIKNKQVPFNFDLSEHVIVLSDWTGSEANELFIKHYFGGYDELPRTILCNGRSRYTNLAPLASPAPAARFRVERNKKYRFRIISSAFMDNPIVVRFDNHKILVIASDGADVQPVEVDSLTILAGERFDVVIHANQSPGLYWIRFQGLVQGELSRAFGAAILRYSGESTTAYPGGPAPSYDNNAATGQNLNGLNMPDNNIPINELRATNNNGILYTGVPHSQIYVTFDITKKLVSTFQLSHPTSDLSQLPLTDMPSVNNINLKLLSTPLLSQRDQIPPNSFCNGDTVSPLCATTACSCLHVIKIRKDAVVELIFIDEGKLYNVSHPFHLHGHYMAILASERISDKTTSTEVFLKDISGEIKRNYDNPPLKDTVAVPDGGYVVARFIANNPGFWFLHCHIEFHADLGMGLVFKVGDDSEMLPVPPNFPTCGDYNN